MGIRRAEISVTTDASGAGTASSRPISGLLREVRLGGTALNNGGSADFTITRDGDGGTVLAVTNLDGAWSRSPRQLIHSSTGGTLDTGGLTSAITAQVGEIPIEGSVRVVVAQGAPSKTDTVYVFYGD